jgi:hypothetical protein
MDRSHDQHLERLLAGAVFEYLDKGMIDELMGDLHFVINQEIKVFENRVGTFKSALNRFGLSDVEQN